MSSILKALQRLEAERDRKKLQRPDIIGSSITDETSRNRTRRPSRPMIIIYSVSLVASGMLLAFFILMPPIAKKPVMEFQKISPEDAIRRVMPAKPENKSSQPARGPAIPKNRDSQKTNTLPTMAKPGNEGTPDAKPQSQTAKAERPKLDLNGIAYSSGEPSSSIAIINGKHLAVGGTIEGARLEEIQKDRVKLVYGKETFELTLSR